MDEPARKTEPATVTESERRTRTVVEKVRSFLRGDDVFISYARWDSTGYATALADRLSEKGFLCFLDQYGTDVHDQLPERMKLKLRRSTVLVLIGSLAAIKSKAIREEVELFKETERAIIPIDVDGAFSDTDLYKVVRGLPLASDPLPKNAATIVPVEKKGVTTRDEAQVEVEANEKLIRETAENLLLAEPSREVIDAIGESFDGLGKPDPSQGIVERIRTTVTYTKRTRLQRRMLLGSALFILLSVGGALYFGAIASAAAKRAVDSSVQAARAQLAADNAQARMQDANQKLQDATDATKRAEDRERVANDAAALAEGNAAKAAEREQLARQREAQATANAKNQEEIAASRELAANAFATLNTDLNYSLRMSVNAYDKRPTTEARIGLLKSLQLHPYLQKIWREPASIIFRAAITPDGEVLVRSGEGDLVFQDARTGQPFAWWPVPQAVNDMAVSPDGARIAAWTSAYHLDVWDVTGATGQRRVKFDNKFNLGTPCGGRVGGPTTFGPDGNTIIFGDYIPTGCDGAGAHGLVFLDIATGDTNFYPSRQTRISTLTLSPDGQTLAVGGEDEIELWDVKQRVPRPVALSIAGIREQPGGLKRGPVDWFTSLSFSPDGTTLASARQSNAVVLWDVKSHVIIGEHLKDAGSLVAFDPRPQSKSLATASGKGTLTLWNTSPKTPEKVWTEAYPSIVSLSFNGPDETILTGSQGGTVAFWKTDAGRKLGQVVANNHAGYLDFSREGDLLVSIDKGSAPTATLWDYSAARGDISPSSRSLHDIKLGTFRPLAQLAERAPGQQSPTEITRILDLTGSDVKTPEMLSEYLKNGHTAAVSPDGKLLAAVEGLSVVLWDISDLKNPRRLNPLNYPENPPTCVAFSRDGRLVVVGYTNGDVGLFDTVGEMKVFNAAETIVPGAIFNDVRSVAVSNDGKTVASSSVGTRLIYLWDASTEVPTLIGSLGGALTHPDLAGSEAWSLVFSPDGKKLLSGSGDGIIVWDVDPLSWRERAFAMQRKAPPEAPKVYEPRLFKERPNQISP
jgi:WD40 repeat protein/Skp family chaperone for outer membrane proteins